ncbi:MAG: oxygenase MpaB family protein [bacterium]|nr:oxygenase MpaB family protein [bacterium]
MQAAGNNNTDLKIPTEFHYWQNMGTPRVKRARMVFRRMFGFEPDLSEDLVRQYAASYYDADPLAEAFVDEAYLQGDPVKGRAMLDLALEQGLSAVPDAPESLRNLFAGREVAPAWLDLDLAREGARVFRRYGPELFNFFGAITLEGYTNNSVVKPLILTGAYAGDSTKSRFLETSAFWIDMSEPGGIEQGSEGWKTSMRVRVMHVFVRRRLLSHPEWRLDDWGVPISQADALVTLMAGCIAPGYFLRIAGFRTSEHDILAMMHFWRYVGFLMGVEPRWYPETVKDGLKFSFMAFVSGAGQAGADGVMLCRSFSQAFRPVRKENASWLEKFRDQIDHRVHQGFVDFFVSKTTRKAAGIPSAGLWRLYPLASAPVVFTAETLRKQFPGLENVADKVSRYRRRKWLDRHMAKRKAEYTAGTSFAR